MLGEGVRAGLRHLGREVVTVCHVEIEAYAAAVLAARMQEGSLDAAPIWSDIRTFDARDWTGAVDLVMGGFPCQDLSVAGKRAGLDGARSGLFFDLLRVANDSGAFGLILENVGGIASASATVVDEAGESIFERACSRVMGELADSGWNAEWLTLRASDVGANHQRERWFCLAWRRVAHGHDDERPGQCVQLRPGRQEQTAPDAGRTDAALADTDSAGLGSGGRQGHDRSRHSRPDDGACGTAVADAASSRPQGPRPEVAPRWDEPRACGATGGVLPLFAPGPQDDRWSGILAERPDLAPALERPIRGVVDGVESDLDGPRALALRCVGNGVVALQAAAATVVLVRRAGIFGG